MSVFRVCIFAYILAITIPPVLADITSNADFDPFPQMEQDQNNIDADTAAKPEQQNDDVWPPVNSDAQANSEANHE